jgi:hypothetical protein
VRRRCEIEPVVLGILAAFAGIVLGFGLLLWA